MSSRGLYSYCTIAGLSLPRKANKRREESTIVRTGSSNAFQISCFCLEELPRAAEEISRGSDAIHTVNERTQPYGLTLKTLPLCLTLMGLQFPVSIQQRDKHKLSRKGQL